MLKFGNNFRKWTFCRVRIQKRIMSLSPRAKLPISTMTKNGVLFSPFTMEDLLVSLKACQMRQETQNES